MNQKKINKKYIYFDYRDSCCVPEQQLSSLMQTLTDELTRIQKAQKSLYSSTYASINLPSDTEAVEAIITLAKEKKSHHPTTVIVIGIGGSNLGTIALIEALYGKFYNNKSSINFYYADTIDSDYLTTVLHYAEKELCSGNNIILNIISKSGTTTETIVNFQLFFELVKKHRPYTYHEYIVITTDKNSALWHFGQAHSISLLDIPDMVGGRYSVFSAVGLFPLAMIGADIVALHQGARTGVELSLTRNYSNNPAATSAAILYALYQQGYTIHDTFLFSVELESLGKWYRQLMAESIGKSRTVSGDEVNNGITPTVSVGSTDLHSVVQLYLSGPYTTFTTFISVEKNKTNLHVKDNATFNQLKPSLKSESVATIMHAILQGTMSAYKNNNRPYVHTAIPEKNEYYLGQFMQIKMMEIMYLGFLMNVNPFDQPSVELYKIETKKLLSQR